MGNYAIRTIVEILAAAPTFEEAKAGLDGTFAEVELHLRKHYGANVQ